MVAAILDRLCAYELSQAMPSRRIIASASGDPRRQFSSDA